MQYKPYSANLLCFSANRSDLTVPLINQGAPPNFNELSYIFVYVIQNYKKYINKVKKYWGEYLKQIIYKSRSTRCASKIDFIKALK